jgi:hypothetical protein
MSPPLLYLAADTGPIVMDGLSRSSSGAAFLCLYILWATAMDYSTEEFIDALEGYIDWLIERLREAKTHHRAVPVQGFTGYLSEYVEASRAENHLY